jgi:hypothetical protein
VSATKWIFFAPENVGSLVGWVMGHDCRSLGRSFAARLAKVLGHPDFDLFLSVVGSTFGPTSSAVSILFVHAIQHSRVDR